MSSSSFMRCYGLRGTQNDEEPTAPFSDWHFDFDLAESRRRRPLGVHVLPINADRLHRAKRSVLLWISLSSEWMGVLAHTHCIQWDRLRSRASTFGSFFGFLNTSLPHNGAIGAGPDIVSELAGDCSDKAGRALEYEYTVIARRPPVAPKNTPAYPATGSGAGFLRDGKNL